jgi:GT2 family glycosyltransferase
LIYVVIATAGRPDQLRACLEGIGGQSRPPDKVLVSTVQPGDLPAGGRDWLDGLPFETHVLFGPKGLTRQRNRALAEVRRLDGATSADDIVVFFDDDFVPRADWLQSAEDEFAARRECVGLTGVLLADGANGPGYARAEAEAILSSGRGRLRRGDERARPGRARALYGCNMAMRASALAEVRFDEALPLYGWLEDEDMSGQLRKLGQLVRAASLVGVHLGAKAGRVPGAAYGYSQIANPVHLVRKRTCPASHAALLMSRNLAANILKSPWPEPYVDRLSRLKGNWLALRDLARGRLSPGAAAALR